MSDISHILHCHQQGLNYVLVSLFSWPGQLLYLYIELLPEANNSGQDSILGYLGTILPNFGRFTHFFVEFERFSYLFLELGDCFHRHIFCF